MSGAAGGWPWSGRAPRFLASGRQALAWLVAATLKPGARVQCPACICTSVPDSLRSGGAEVVFYPQDDELLPRWDLIGPTEALLLWHPLGRRLPVRPLLELRRRHPRMIVIEDFSHTLLNRAGAAAPPGVADFGIASLRKLLPVADGGVAVSWRGQSLPPAPPPAAEPSDFVRKRLAGDASAEDDLDAWRGSPAPVWQPTLNQLSQLEPTELRRARRARYRTLEAALADLEGIRPIWPALPDGLAPYAFAAHCRNRHDLRRRLQAAGIPADPFWPIPEGARATAGVRGRLLAGTLLLVSCDPRLPPPSLDNIRVRH